MSFKFILTVFFFCVCVCGCVSARARSRVCVCVCVGVVHKMVFVTGRYALFLLVLPLLVLRPSLLFIRL